MGELLARIEKIRLEAGKRMGFGDVTKSVIFNVEFLGEGATFQPGQNVIGFEGTTEIDRRDFNVNFEGNLENEDKKVLLELQV